LETNPFWLTAVPTSMADETKTKTGICRANPSLALRALSATDTGSALKLRRLYQAIG